MASNTENKKVEILTSAESFTAQATNEDCCISLTSVGKRSTSSDVDSDGVLARVSFPDGALQQVVSTSLRFPFSFVTIPF